MRALTRTAGVLAVSVVMTLVAVPVGAPALGVDDGVPTRQDVRDARDAALGAERDVAAVQADLAAANARLQASAVAAARAAEAWNGARHELRQARAAAAAATDRASIATGDVERQQAAYADALVSSYELSPTLSAMSSIVQADGISTVFEQATTMQAAEAALDSRYDGFRAAATLAEVARTQAEDAEADAVALQERARVARDAAQQAAGAAQAQAQAIAAQKDGLIRELAALQDTSVALAEQRQSALEEKAAREAAAAAEAAAQQAAEEAEAAPDPEPQATPQPAQPAQPSQPEAPSTPATPPTPSAPPAPPAPPAPSGGASAAVAFARAQLGEPYRWGAAGPDAWDCSGLTMGAWAAGGTSLPHYSVAQYEQSTPVAAGSLRPGDLVFWGSSSSPSSIYHVALYAGNGRIVHAPRTGRPVVEESMYYWTTPNFFARP